MRISKQKMQKIVKDIQDDRKRSETRSENIDNEVIKNGGVRFQGEMGQNNKKHG